MVTAQANPYKLVVALLGIIGKPVKIRYGPAAVIGDETRHPIVSRFYR